MPEASEKPRKRLPAIEKSITDISADRDVRVRILGTLLDSSDNTILIDDGTGKAEVSFDDGNGIDGLQKGQLVRIIARVLPLIDGYALRGEAVQRLEGFDIQLYKKAKQLGL
ncbi:MAG: hypothetical protein V1887_00320 [Candidatus Aenigmatarchaeota archaeon]